MRIGELSRRCGVSPELLRMWELRYKVVQPARTEGGFRLYSAADEARVRAMRSHIAQGLPAAVAAQFALAQQEPVAASTVTAPPEEFVNDLRRAFDDFDEVAANAALDRVFAAYSLDTALDDVILAYLRDLGARWEASTASIAQEHFATGIVRGRLLGLARGWGTGSGPWALLACPAHEYHDLGLICFGLILRQYGWRILFLGPNTPVATLAQMADQLRPQLVVLNTVQPEIPVDVRDDIAALGCRHDVWLAAPGQSDDDAQALHASLLRGSPVAAAAELGSARAFPSAPGR